MLLTMTHAPVAPAKRGEPAADGQSLRSLSAFDRARLERPDTDAHSQVICLTAVSRAAGRSRRKSPLARLYEAVCRSQMAKAEQLIASYRQVLDDAGRPTTVPQGGFAQRIPPVE
ncbi:MAG: hypothetical protein R3D62_05445 [Xanthobacteraceae bacterium]